MTTRPSAARRLAYLFIPTAIAGCLRRLRRRPDAAGGGDGGSATISLSGTAAAGAAIAGGTVEARCATGSGNAATQADGRYALDIDGGELPCSLSVTSADGATVLHSAAAGSGRSARANLTPATELAMAQLHGRNPAEAHAAFDAAAAAALTTGALQSGRCGGHAAGRGRHPAQRQPGQRSAGHRRRQRPGAGPAGGQPAGSGGTLAGVVAAVAAQARAPRHRRVRRHCPRPSCWRARRPTATPLPGAYRVVFAGPNGGVDRVTLDAPTLTLTGSDGAVEALVANGDCRYTVPSGGDLLVTQAGLGVVRSREGPGGSHLLGVVFPEQVHPVSVTQGEWNLIGLGDVDSDSGQGTPRLFAGVIRFDAAGRSTGTTRFCANVRDCEDEPALAAEVHTVHPDGGFHFDGGRHFVYRLGSGQRLLVSLAGDGAFVLAVPKTAAGVPPVGVPRRSLNFTLTPAFSANAALSPSENTVRSVDAASGIYTRDAVVDFATGVTQPERIALDRFLPGFIHRIPETVTDSAGALRNVGEWVGLPLPGMGFTPVGILGNNQLILSVAQPAP